MLTIEFEQHVYLSGVMAKENKDNGGKEKINNFS